MNVRSSWLAALGLVVLPALPALGQSAARPDGQTPAMEGETQPVDGVVHTHQKVSEWKAVVVLAHLGKPAGFE